MSNESNLNDKVLEILKAFEPTEEDLKRELQQDEMKELCLRLKCRVNMHHWNPVQDYVRRLMREGRLQNKSRRSALKLLAKAVNRNKEHALYGADEIRAVREQLWRERKKENLMRLEVWQYDRQQAGKIHRLAHRQTAEQLGYEKSMSALSIHSSQEQQQQQQQDEVEVEVEQVEEQETEELEDNSDDGQYVEADKHYDMELFNEYLNVNTESMTLSNTNTMSEQLLTQEDPMDMQVVSQPVLYEEFDIHLPMTSTQKSTD